MKHLHYSYPEFERINKRFTFIGLSAGTIGTMALMGGGIAGSMGAFGGKKQDRNVPDPLAGLRAQLQGLAGQIPAQVAKQKEINAARAGEARTTGMQGINENIRAERGFGNTSLQDRLNSELLDKILQSQSEADLKADIWGTGEQARILQGTSSMYPSGTELPQEENWGANLLGAGANMAVSNYLQDQQWARLAKALGGGGSAGSNGSVLPGLSSGLQDVSSDWGSKYLMLN